ncbi:transcriptional regulator [Halobacteria archaeon AArc-m2/3/4]|uniref:Transcriptional regulator n=1 Tax=Natronoglomus mannanivorans TaxID=2979990 RepID=A0AAP2Z0E8_9EURY|nr:transcriptional regulator [Halobacteria archaeon AArc-xg1-1]MCU4974740.1 transcriptional regulator [Halobacteria archaeon AArc-m2/3/4]
MPVRFDEYVEQADSLEWTPKPESNARTILSFLFEHPETGFTPSEIATATGIPEGSVGPTLGRLREFDLVRHEEPYWAIGDDDRIAAYEATLQSLATLDDQYGDEGWGTVDRREYEVDEDAVAEWRERRREAETDEE